METINWQGAIAKNRDALVRIVAILFSIAGLTTARRWKRCRA